MTKKERVLKLLLDQRKPDAVIDEERLKVLLNPDNPTAEVDWDQVQNALGFSSLQNLAFLNSVNAEFGTKLTADSFMKMNTAGEFLAMLE